MARIRPSALAPASAIACALVVAGMAAWLLWVGREPIAPSGRILPWYGDPSGPESSQHLFDWYSPSHVIHGLVFFAALWLAARRMPLGWRLAVALAVEAAWELAENSDAVIERYRTTTVSKDYGGDTVVNSLADLACMALGFWLARRLPVWASVALALAFEALTIALIRDGLALNVLMLLHPVEAVRDWQAG